MKTELNLKPDLPEGIPSPSKHKLNINCSFQGNGQAGYLEERGGGAWATGRKGREGGRLCSEYIYKRRTKKKKYREGEIPASPSFANATSLEQRCPLIPKRSSVYLQECLIKSENSI